MVTPGQIEPMWGELESNIDKLGKPQKSTQNWSFRCSVQSHLVWVESTGGSVYLVSDLSQLRGVMMLKLPVVESH